MASPAARITQHGDTTQEGARQEGSNDRACGTRSWGRREEDRVPTSFEINSEKCLPLTYPVTRPISVRAGYPWADGGHLAHCFGRAGRSPPDAHSHASSCCRAARRGPRKATPAARRRSARAEPAARRVPIAGKSASLLPSEGLYLEAAVPADLNSECRQPARNAIAGIRWNKCVPSTPSDALRAICPCHAHAS